MMEIMTNIHVNGSILCFQKLQLLSCLSKQSTAKCYHLRARGGHQLLLLSLSLDALICRAGRDLDPWVLLQDSNEIKVHKLCALQAPPLSCSSLIKKQRGYFVTSLHQTGIHKRGFSIM